MATTARASLAHSSSFPSLNLSILQNPNPPPNPTFPNFPKRRASTQSSITGPFLPLKKRLLTLIADERRGVKTLKNSTNRSKIVEAIEDIAALSRDLVTTGPSLSGTWRLLWTTEKEQLFIIDNAFRFGTRAGDVLQVIDVANCVLSNVITFPPHGAFFVRSDIEIASQQRVNFRFTSAVLRGDNWEFPLPPFGQGWFESMYLDEEIRIAKDIRGDYLIVDRAPYDWKE